MNLFHTFFCRSDHWRTKLEQSLPWVLDGVALGPSTLEIGPGPGSTTAILRKKCKNLTVLELDPQYVKKLTKSFSGGQVDIKQGSATEIPFRARSFSSVAAFTMLHHIPTHALQNKMFEEVFRVLKKGGKFIASDSRHSIILQLFHVFDNYNPVDPATLNGRLKTVGFKNIRIETLPGAFKLQATKP